MKQRLVQYDILKGIGIFLMVICHAGLDGYAKECIYTFHMPLFFFASGCFFTDRDLPGYLSKNIKQLLIPYLFFAFCMIIARYLRTPSFQLSSFSGFLCSLNPLLETDPNLYDSIWFLICLFNVRIFYWFINRACRGVLWIKAVICVVWYCVGFILQRLELNLPFFIDTSLSVLLFYVLGEIFHSKGYDKKMIPWWLGCVGVVLCISVSILLHPYVELKLNIYPFYLALLSLIMILSIYYICKSMIEYKNGKRLYVFSFLEKAGISSLTILGLHNPIIWIFGHYLQIIPAPSIVILFIEVLLTITVIIYIEKLIYKYLPFLLGRF